VGTLLQAINKREIRPVLISRPYVQIMIIFSRINIIHVHVIFVGPEEENDINNPLENQSEDLEENFELFNMREMFVVVTMGYEKLSPRNYANK
jgi:hypothetical protein